MPAQSTNRFQPNDARRHIIGIASIVLLGLAAYFSFQDGSQQLFLFGSCLKTGIVLLVTWIAYPQLDQLSPWWIVGLIACLLVLAFQPRVILTALRYSLVLAPILFLIWLLRPRKKSRPRN